MFKIPQGKGAGEGKGGLKERVVPCVPRLPSSSPEASRAAGKMEHLLPPTEPASAGLIAALNHL